MDEKRKVTEKHIERIRQVESAKSIFLVSMFRVLVPVAVLVAYEEKDTLKIALSLVAFLILLLPLDKLVASILDDCLMDEYVVKDKDGYHKYVPEKNTGFRMDTYLLLFYVRMALLCCMLACIQVPEKPGINVSFCAVLVSIFPFECCGIYYFAHHKGAENV